MRAPVELACGFGPRVWAGGRVSGWQAGNRPERCRPARRSGPRARVGSVAWLSGRAGQKQAGLGGYG